MFPSFAHPRRLLCAIALLGAIGGACFAGPAPSPARDPAQLELALKEAIPYAYRQTPQGELMIHGFFPSGWTLSDRRPAIVFFFGGSWLHGSPGQFADQAKYFASRGMVAFCADYRVRERHETTPFECIEDGKAAIRWVRDHAGELGVDPARIAAAGGSAGGHVALAAAVLLGPEEAAGGASGVPDALVLFNPVVDTTLAGIRGRKLEEMVNHVLGDRAEEASPAHHLRSGLPPAIIFHGKADKTVPFESVTRFAERYAATGNKCTLMAYDGQGHGFYIKGGPHFRSVVLREADRFLASLGWLAGEPSLAESPSNPGESGPLRADQP